MNIAVDIGNTRLKCGVFFSDEENEVAYLPLPLNGEKIEASFVCQMLQWESLSDDEVSFGKTLTMDVYPTPITWWIAPTGSFPWQDLKAEILKVRPRDIFKIITQRQIPLSGFTVDSLAKVGIDRLLAVFAVVEKYGDVPMLIVDAGTAITVDVVQNRIFCGGAILPGLTAMSSIYPKISEKLPLVPIPAPFSFSTDRPVYPGKNTEDAIRNGIYWGTIGAIRQFYDMFFPRTKQLILTGGDADYLMPGLSTIIPSRRIKRHDDLVLEGIHRYRCVAE